MNELIKKLNGGTAESRLAALKELFEKMTDKPARRDNDANNHIHTIYSFSPYSPTKAAYMAYMAGLTSAGIMDHDSLSGVEEFNVLALVDGAVKYAEVCNNTTEWIEYRVENKSL